MDKCLRSTTDNTAIIKDPPCSERVVSMDSLSKTCDGAFRWEFIVPVSVSDLRNTHRNSTTFVWSAVLITNDIDVS